MTSSLHPVLTLFRWILFFPIQIILISIIQTIVLTLFHLLPFWIVVLIYLFFGWFAIVLSFTIVGKICPKPKIGFTIVLVIFTILELAFLITSHGKWDSPYELIMRVILDGSILTGLLAGGEFLGIEPKKDQQSEQ